MSKFIILFLASKNKHSFHEYCINPERFKEPCDRNYFLELFLPAVKDFLECYYLQSSLILYFVLKLIWNIRFSYCQWFLLTYLVYDRFFLTSQFYSRIFKFFLENRLNVENRKLFFHDLNFIFYRFKKDFIFFDFFH